MSPGRFRSVPLSAVVVTGALLTAPGCRALGYSADVLQRVPSPDSRYVAVCQEVPAFDGPNYDIRLERPDGTKIRSVHSGGDAMRCAELAWAPDSRTLAWRSGTTVWFIDVDWILARPEGEPRHWPWPSHSFAPRTRPPSGWTFRFVSVDEIWLTPCSVESIGTDCQPDAFERYVIPSPIVPVARND